MAVEIVGDPDGLLKPDTNAFIIINVSDYVPGVRHIKNALAQGHTLQVIVQNPACTVWLERMAFSYSDTDVRYSRISARDLLAERWQTSLPEQISDDAILVSGFLEANIEPRTGQSYEEIVLEYFWGEFFTFNRLPVSLAGDLVENLDLARWQQNQKLPLAMQALQTCRIRWLGYAGDTKTRTFIEAIFDNPERLKHDIVNYKLLRGYPTELGQAVLGNWYTLFKGLNLDPTPVSLEGQDIADATQEIQYYLNSLSSQIASTTDLLATLNHMSGWLVEEFEWTTQFLQTNEARIKLTSELIRQIAERFRPIHYLIEDQLISLEAAIPPKYPDDPSQNKTITDWLNWAVEDYLPYRFWLEENDRFDEKVAAYAGVYADWFFDNCVEHKYQAQDRWVFNLLNTTLTSVKAGRKVLFIIIDNFNYKFLKRLLELFGQQDFRIVDAVESMWAMIPTATEISKWGLIAGEADLSNIQGTSYQAILDKDWQGHFAGYQVAYLPKIGALKKRRDFPENLMLLNYLPIDDVLHKDEDQIGRTHAEEIQGYLKTLVTEVVKFAKRARVERDLDIFIASDHGSTKIPAAIDNVLDDAFYRQQAKDKHHRYISVPPGRVANPTAYDQEHCYIVRSDYMGTRENYLIAKGYDRFVPTKESVYVHGGLTPEETIVPFCRLVKMPMITRQPTIKLPDNLVRISVKAELVFVIGNPNDARLSNIELGIRESDLPGVMVDKIPAGLTRDVAVPVRLKRRLGAKTLEEITIEGSFEYEGQRHVIKPVQIPIEVKTLMESKAEFDFDI